MNKMYDFQSLSQAALVHLREDHQLSSSSDVGHELALQVP
jgi:hypothetical protein